MTRADAVIQPSMVVTRRAVLWLVRPERSRAVTGFASTGAYSCPEQRAMGGVVGSACRIRGLPGELGLDVGSLRCAQRPST